MTSSDTNNKLDLCIEIEQKRYTFLNSAYTDTKNRRLLLITAEFAIFTFLFSDIQALIPNELYGAIFFALGIISGILSLALSFYHCRPMPWPDPIGATEYAKINATNEEAKWKQTILDDYKDANNRCKELLKNYARTLKWSLIFFVISITILLIIKYF